MIIMTITLATLPQATRQQVFDHGATHLLTQRKRSTKDALIHGCMDAGCAYHGDNGLMCGAGCFIGDNEYYPWMEGKTWSQLIDNYPTFIPDNHADLIMAFQRIHDGTPSYEWYNELYKLAHRHQFNTKCLTNIS